MINLSPWSFQLSGIYLLTSFQFVYYNNIRIITIRNIRIINSWHQNWKKCFGIASKAPHGCLKFSDKFLNYILHINNTNIVNTIVNTNHSILIAITDLQQKIYSKVLVLQNSLYYSYFYFSQDWKVKGFAQRKVLQGKNE